MKTEQRISPKVEKVFEKVEKFLKFKFFYTHTKMAGRTRELYKIEPRISVPFMLELKYESIIILKKLLVVGLWGFYDIRPLLVQSNQ